MSGESQSVAAVAEAGPIEPFGAVEERPVRPALLRFAAAAWPYALVLAVGLFVLLPGISEFGFWDPWEPKYAESSREMMEKDSYVTPYYRYEIRLTKPILVYWGVILGSKIFGLNELGARFVGLLAALGSMLGVCYAVSLMRGRRAGILSAIVLATIPHFYFIGRQAMPDVYLFTSLGSSLLFFALGLLGPSERRNIHFGISYACCGLAVLAKGPVLAFTILGATLAIFAFTTVNLKPLWQPGTRLETVRFGLSLAVALPLTAVFGVIAFLFGTSPLWWAYDDTRRGKIGEFRELILTRSTELHLAEIFLAGIGFALALLAVQYLRTSRSREAGRSWMRVAAAATAVGAIVAGGGLLLADDERKVLFAGLLGATICATSVPVAVRRLILTPGIRERVAPWLAPIVQQLALFAIVFTVVAGPWHVAIVFEQGHGYFTDFILKHNVNRAIEKVNSAGRSDFYLRTLIFGYFPWTAFIPIALASLVGWWDAKPLRRYGLEIFMIIAAVTTFTVFSGPRTKFPHYLAPLLIPLAVLIGLAIHRALERRSTPGGRLTWVAAAMLYLLPMLDLIREDGPRYLLGSFTVKRWIPDALQTQGYVLGLIVAGFGLLLLAGLLRSRIVVGGFVLCATLMAHYYSGTFIPQVSAHKSLKYVVGAYEQYAMPGEPIGFHGDMKHGIFYYTDHKVELLGDVDEFLSFLDPERRAFVVIERSRLGKIRGTYKQIYPGHTLHLIDGSHFAYHLIANFEIDGIEPAEHEN